MATGSSSNEHLIEKDGGIDPPLNYAFLRSQALDLAQRYSGDSWTDFNIHDPGVTIMENLCFAITDLAYRTNFRIEDLLTNKEGLIDRGKNSFFTRKEILTTNPVSDNDYRKLILDNVPELYNVWLEPMGEDNIIQPVKGLYKVLMQLNTADLEEYLKLTESGQTRLKNRITASVKNLLLKSRNIGEDIEELELLKPLNIDIKADILIAPALLPEKILAEIYTVLSRALNPGPRFYTENELTQWGFSTEEKFNGPALAHGFILDEDLGQKKLRVIEPSNLVKEIAAIEGVLQVRNLSLISNGREISNKQHPQDKSCHLQKNEFPYFNFNVRDPQIRIFTEDDNIPVKLSLFKSMLKKNDDDKGIGLKNLTADNNDDLPDPRQGNDKYLQKGKYRNVSYYFSIQHLFPPVYRLLEDQSHQHDTNLQKETTSNAQVKQLKAYLMIFEQIMANYLSQLGNIDTLLSGAGGVQRYPTYFSQPLYTVPGAEKILGNGYDEFLTAMLDTVDVNLDRKNRALDQMLARFNCVPRKYPVELFTRLYGGQNNTEESMAVLKWKADLLREIGAHTKNRNQGFNYSKKDGTDKLGGFEKKMNRLLFINATEKMRLTGPFDNSTQAITIRQDTSSALRKEEPVKTYTIQIADEELVILDEAIQQQNATAGVLGQSNKLALPKITLGFLKDGLNRKHYRIIEDTGKPGGNYLLIYKAPKQPYWKRIGRFYDKKTAETILNDFVLQLRNFNIHSEGFHLVEHILLRPPSDARVFGFALLQAGKYIIAKQNEWTTFDDRERTLKRIIDVISSSVYKLYKADTGAADPYKDILLKMESLCLIANHHEIDRTTFVSPASIIYKLVNIEENQRNRLLRQVVDNFQKLATKEQVPYPVVKSVVRLSDGKEVKEDFFDLRMTIVLPAWPARFQHTGFREFIEKLFIDNSPVHMRLHFKWLDINDMKIFEDLYFAWLDSLKNNSIESMEDAGQLSSFLCDKTFHF